MVMKRGLKNVNKKEIKGRVKSVRKEPLVEEKVERKPKWRFSKKVKRMSDPEILEALIDAHSWAC